MESVLSSNTVQNEKRKTFVAPALMGLALVYLWAHLINHLHIEWTFNPQYNYGWAVPFLCVYLLWNNLSNRSRSASHHSRQNSSPPRPGRGQGEVSNSSFPLSLDRLEPDATLANRMGEGLGARDSLETLIARHSSPVTHHSSPVTHHSQFLMFCFLLLAFCFLPTRLIEEANPDWRLVSWALALETIGITLCSLRFTIHHSSFTIHHSSFSLSTSHFIFPICFFLVAVPWPTVIEGPLIQILTRAVASITIEVLGFFGVPAMSHGNVIELSTGLLGIDEACSGIRSFQATLMISLFLGELYRLTIRRRILFCLSGFALAFLFNVARTLVLTTVAAHKGIAAVATWHDPAGVAILVGCFLCLWGLGLLLRPVRPPISIPCPPTSDRGPSTSDLRPPTSGSYFSLLTSHLSLGIGLCFWLLLTETGVEIWYSSHEQKLPVAKQWNVNWPTNNPTFAEISFPEKTRQILRYNEGRNASWTDGDKQWQVTFLRWNPGRTALYLARNHTPEICLPAAGRKLISTSELEWFDVRGLHLPFREYNLEDQGTSLRVFYCLWNDRATEQGFASMGLNYANRLAPVLAGLRNPGQRSIEIAIRGIADESDAKAALQLELETIIAVK
jgi:exosortase